MNIATYIRVSTELQQESGLGLDAQRRAVNAYCVAHWPTSSPVEHVEVLSAKTVRDRPILSALLRDLPSGSALVVLRLDRLCRNTLDLLNTLRLLDERKISLHSVHEFIATDTPAGRVMVTMLGAMAEYERDLICQRTKSAMAVAKAAGRHCGRPPFGFVNADLVPDREELRTVAKALRLRSCGLSIRKIARRCHVSVSTARYVISNPIYSKQIALSKILTPRQGRE